MAVIAIPLTTLAVGTQDFGPAAVADADSSAALVTDRTPANGFNSQPASTTASIQVMQSGDGGATWDLRAAAGIAGGLYPAPHGGNYLQSTVTVALAPGTGRQVKATVVVAGASVAVSGSLTIS
jgi:hypothetical protein